MTRGLLFKIRPDFNKEIPIGGWEREEQEHRRHPTRCTPEIEEMGSATTSKELYEFDNPEGNRPMYEKSTECFCCGH
jgi:hypothetical protein